ncbi:hypothetical protein [Streptomyces chryseus]
MPPDAIETARLLVSELTTNAIQHRQRSEPTTADRKPNRTPCRNVNSPSRAARPHTSAR